MKVSKREAFLLFVLALFAISGLMVSLLILPLMEKNNSNQILLNELENKKTLIDSTVVREKKLNQEYEDRRLEVSTKIHQLEDPLNEAQFEQWVLPLATKYNMRVLETIFDEPGIMTPIAIERLPVDLDYEIRDMEDQVNGVAKKEDKIPETTAMMMLAKYTYKVQTTYPRYVYFLNDVVQWDTSIIITESSYDFEKSEATYTFDVYTLHQLMPDGSERKYDSDITAKGTGTGKVGESALSDYYYSK